MRTIIFLVLCVFFTACRKKEKLNLFQKIDANFTDRLNQVVFTSPTTGYAVGGKRYDESSILKTTNGGLNWSTMHIPASPKALYGICFKTIDTGFAVGYDGHLLYTYDGGNNWTETATLWKPAFKIAYAHPSLGYIIAGSSYRKGWIAPINATGQMGSVVEMDTELADIQFTNSQVGYICGYGLVLKTTNGGSTWQPTNAKGDFFKALHFISPDLGFVVGYNGTILKTTNGGTSWKKLRNGNSSLKKQWHLYDVYFTTAEHGYIVGDNGFFAQTSNGGNDWEQYETRTDETFRSIDLKNSTEGVIVGDNGSVYLFKN